MRFSGDGPVANYIALTGLGLPKMAAEEFQADTLTLCSQSSDPLNAHRVVLCKPRNIRSFQATLDKCK